MKPWTVRLSRRSVLAIAISALVACGGGTQVGMPGTGGTGMYAQGSISGFGSVVVNNIKFDDVNATVQVNGMAARSSDLRIGMVASVQGQRGATPTLGTAERIEVWSVAQGVISQLAAGQFTLNGMTIKTDSGTMFDGVASAAQLSPGLRVAVWGLQASADGRSWTATRVAIVPDTAAVSSGVVGVTSGQRLLNGVVLTGTAAGTLNAGDLVRVTGTLSAAGDSLEVASVRLQGPLAGTAQGEGEVEGVVTSVLSARHFMMGSIEVDASSAVLSPSTLQITAGARLEAEGTWQAGVLKATKLEAESEQTLTEVEIEATIEQFTSVANFVVRGQRCDASQAVISHGTAADLKAGIKVKVKGNKAGDVLMVTELEIET
ncbi:DUF5666 domain-containing protein [Herbaspirillum sp. ST 5-3]|uniref:DUF5666 domain-containing protein n=1 Tax=Oxalobacteraceae TaxID=75682 RepID=UPI0010A2B708|nr:DUF5666 domain-containing protein [Herbaspirillum sp. ST 5-3]